MLFAIGFKGGHELHGSGLTPDIAIALIAAVIVAAVVSIYSFFILWLKLDVYASASYIAVPVAMRLTVPEANPSLYLSMALALTFPFNIIIGISIYFQLIQRFWS
ncbi:MAG: sodium-dependent bicarbonate transport family permease [Cyanobacteria bacterium P01_A01_bin.123]